MIINCSSPPRLFIMAGCLALATACGGGETEESPEAASAATEADDKKVEALAAELKQKADAQAERIEQESRGSGSEVRPTG